jgi:spore coat polysaccharide biosynthesis protein SpsF (cytidylyltransferase family)
MILAILQARLSSTRLPGKVLKEILGKPMLQLELERIQQCKSIDKIIVATSDASDDKDIKKLCDTLAIDCYQGNLGDVLDRYYQAAIQYNPDHIVRLSGDCPLHDPILIDKIIQEYLEKELDYCCNTIDPTFPDGLDTWVFSFDALRESWEKAKRPSEREHVVMYIKKNPDKFKIMNYKGNQDLSAMRWTVDEPQDFTFVKTVYEALYLTTPCFTTHDVLTLLNNNPEFQKINQSFIRDEGLLKSLEEDKKLGYN